MLSLSIRDTDTRNLADWLELWAALSGDKSGSLGDLESALRSEGFAVSDNERNVADVAHELLSRMQATEEGYPFTLSNTGVLRAKDEHWEGYSSYLFCLCLSFFGGSGHGLNRIRPERVFEDLCTQVAGKFVGGSSVRFGSPRNRRHLDPVFSRAVDKLLAVHIMEGKRDGVDTRVMISPQDDGLDIVAWRHEPDMLAGKLLLFGACAAGADWDSKLTELTPDAWCKLWAGGQVVSPIVKAFFLPRRIAPNRWLYVSQRAGLLFDRCRIARWCPRLPESDFGDGVLWTKLKLAMETGWTGGDF